ncbi:unnamed protein product, partial [Sphacelaria rigidula]
MYQITTKEASPECIREPTTAADTVGPVASTQELRGVETDIQTAAGGAVTASEDVVVREDTVVAREATN